MDSLRDHRRGAAAAARRLALLLSALALAPAAGQEASPGEPAGQEQMSEVVRFASGDVTLSGLLRLPTGLPPYSAVVLLPGSLATPRDDPRLAAVAEAFVGEGFAALTTDSRGTGGSQGDFDDASLEQLAADAAAAAATLRERPDVRADAVGFWGVSHGATWVGPLAAARAGAAFLVAASGPLVSPEEHTHRFLAARLRDAHPLDDVTVERVTAARRALWSYCATGEGHAAAAAAIAALRDEPWFEAAGLPATLRAPEELPDLPPRVRAFLAGKDLDPLAALGGVRCPVLSVYGAEDERLPVARDAEILRELAARTGVPLTVEVLPGLDHDLQAISGDATGNAPAPEASALMARWAAAQVSADPGASGR